MPSLRIDFDHPSGVVKPLHCINNAPILGADERMFHYLGEAGIPSARLHDTGGSFGGTHFVDIENIFPNFDADPEDPASYDFAFTDWLLCALARQGVKPFYRLGATIENDQKIKAYHIYPPRDNLRWARICEGIIRHYNEGWAGGYQIGIEYWEIWNEPDNEPDVADNPMWKGSMEDYFALYETAANYLKGRFPHLKIGGYASCGFYAILERASAATANVSPRTGYFLDFFEAFLAHITSAAHRAPLDFFSWHTYDSVPAAEAYARYARQRLDAYGLTHTESILNEWGAGPRLRGTAQEASYVAAMMCAMQRGPVDRLMYYDGQVMASYGGLFNPITFTPFPAYDVFRAFDRLYRLGISLPVETEGDGLYACAATGGGAQALLAANQTGQEMSLAIPWPQAARLRSIGGGSYDEPRTVAPGPQGLSLVLPPYGCVLVESGQA